jgi:uncharacterized protein YceH (UPF0502 family)
MTPETLTLPETRVLGVLVEKQRTVPDTYPLSLNALVAGCNQKTSRDPILELSESDVQSILDRLRAASLVIESSGGRVMRYAHNMERVLDLPAPAVALLAVLMLRGPQTAGELRGNADRLHRFADISTVEAYLRELAARAAGALVTELPRLPGTRETRWAHLLAGPVRDARGEEVAGALPRDAVGGAPPDVTALEERLRALEAQVGELASALASLTAQMRDPPR